MRQQGASHRGILEHLEAEETIGTGHEGERLREAVRATDWEGAETQFASIAKFSPGEAFNHLQFALQDEVDVRRIVLAWRAWAMLGLAGEQHAHTMLRQSVRYCLDVEQRMADRNQSRSALRRPQSPQ